MGATEEQICEPARLTVTPHFVIADVGRADLSVQPPNPVRLNVTSAETLLIQSAARVMHERWS